MLTPAPPVPTFRRCSAPVHPHDPRAIPESSPAPLLFPAPASRASPPDVKLREEQRRNLCGGGGLLLNRGRAAGEGGTWPRPTDGAKAAAPAARERTAQEVRMFAAVRFRSKKMKQKMRLGHVTTFLKVNFL